MLCVPVNLDKDKYKDTMTNIMIHTDTRTNRKLLPPVNPEKDKYNDTHRYKDKYKDRPPINFDSDAAQSFIQDFKAFVAIVH